MQEKKKLDGYEVRGKHEQILKIEEQILEGD